MRKPLGLNWDEARRRLVRVQQYIQAGVHDEGEVAAILEERAKRLRESALAGEHVSPDRLVIVFEAGGSRFGLSLSDVTEVITGRRVARVPGAPAALAGLVQVRGEIRPVYDLCRLLDLPVQVRQEQKYILMLRSGQSLFGVESNALGELRTVEAGNRQTPPPAAGYASWMTEDLIMVLDVTFLARKVT